MTPRTSRNLVIALLAVVLLALVSGCTGKQELQTINESASLFHIKIPADWSAQVQQGLIAIYASDEAPSTEKLDNLSMGVFTTKDTTDSPVPEALTYVVEKRAEDRGWTAATISEPETAMIGGREGAVVDVSGTDSQGIDFKALYYFVRTSGAETLVIAASPSDQWDDHLEDVQTIVADEWYWHLPAGAESTTTAQ